MKWNSSICPVGPRDVYGKRFRILSEESVIETDIRWANYDIIICFRTHDSPVRIVRHSVPPVHLVCDSERARRYICERNLYWREPLDLGGHGNSTVRHSSCKYCARPHVRTDDTNTRYTPARIVRHPREINLFSNSDCCPIIIRVSPSGAFRQMNRL